MQFWKQIDFSDPRVRWVSCLLFLDLAFLFWFRPFPILYQVGPIDAYCYMDQLLTYLNLPLVGCETKFHFPGAPMLWFPLAWIVEQLASLFGADPQRWVMAVVGYSGFLFWGLGVLILDRLFQKIRLPLVLVLVFSVTVPILEWVFQSPRLSHASEFMVAAAALYFLFDRRYVLCLGFCFFLGAIRLNDFPVILLLLGKLLDEVDDFSKPSLERKWLFGAGVAAILFSVFGLYLSVVKGYGGASYLHLVLKEITPGVAFRYLFTWGEGFVFVHPAWFSVLVLGLWNLKHMTWLSRFALVWMLLQLTVAIGWDPDSMRLMSRYYVGSYFGALVVAVDLWGRLSPAWRKLGSAATVWTALRQLLVLWTQNTRYSFATVSGMGWLTSLLMMPLLIAVTPLGILAYSWASVLEWHLGWTPSFGPLSGVELGSLTVITLGCLGHGLYCLRALLLLRQFPQGSQA